MNSLFHNCCTALLLAGTLCTTAIAADPAAAESVTDTQIAEMMKKAEAAGTPGEAHKLLATLAGDWTADVTCKMPGSTEPTTTKAKGKATMILGGRFLQEEFTGEFMGKPFHGISLTGYDNVKKKYVNVWLDDMATSILTTEGTPDDTGKIITYTGNMTCPAEGKEKPVKLVVKILSPTSHVFEMHDPEFGEKSKTMEITYTKK